MSLAGALEITLRWDGSRVRSVAVESTRPAAGPRLLQGRAREDCVRTVGTLYSVCGQAQRIAARLAWDAAEQRRAGDGERAAREAALALEAIQEHLWRLCLDLPARLGLAPRPQLLAPLRRGLSTLVSALQPALQPAMQPTMQLTIQPAQEPAPLAQLDACTAGAGAVVAQLRRFVRDDLGLRCAALAEEGAPMDAASVVQALSPGGLGAELVAGLRAFDAMAPAGPFLPAVDADEALAWLLPALRDEPGFERRPHWHGEPRETGALARMVQRGAMAAGPGDGLVARVLARVVELAWLTGRLEALLCHGARAGELAREIAREIPRELPGWVQAAGAAPSEGLAWVHTARGLLLHYVQLAEGASAPVVARYMIVAPTEWNFHPNGVFARGCMSWTPRGEAHLRQGADLLVQSLDPCVPYSIQVQHA